MITDLAPPRSPALRKPRGRELTGIQRNGNRSINKLCTPMERSIAHLANWKVLDTGWRGRLTDFPKAYAPPPDWGSTGYGDNPF